MAGMTHFVYSNNSILAFLHFLIGHLVSFLTQDTLDTMLWKKFILML